MDPMYVSVMGLGHGKDVALACGIPLHSGRVPELLLLWTIKQKRLLETCFCQSSLRICDSVEYYISQPHFCKLIFELVQLV